MLHSFRPDLWRRYLTAFFLTATVAGCGDWGSGETGSGETVAGESPISCSGAMPAEGGLSYPVKLVSDSGETIAFQVLEPIGRINCAKGHPLVLHGHGFGGSRSTEGFENYRESGNRSTNYTGMVSP